MPDAQANLQAILRSPTYLLAEVDTEFLARPELRPVRLQLELLKPEMALVEQGVRSTIVLFGGTQIIERVAAQQRLDAAAAALKVSPQQAHKVNTSRLSMTVTSSQLEAPDVCRCSVLRQKFTAG